MVKFHYTGNDLNCHQCTCQLMNLSGTWILCNAWKFASVYDHSVDCCGLLV